MKKMNVVIAVGLFVANVSALAQKQVGLTDEETKAIFDQSLLNQKQNPEEYELRIEAYNGARKIYSYRKGLQPVVPSIYIMNSSGVVNQVCAEAVVQVINEEKKSLSVANNYDQVVNEYLWLINWSPEKVISTVADIPGYSSKSASQDVEQLIQSSLRANTNQLVKVVYTYRQVGGEIREHIFIFGDHDELLSVDSKVLAKGVGDTKYLE